MIQYTGRDRAVFPAGTILTPLAKDFAAENGIRVVIGTEAEEGAAGKCAPEKEGLTIYGSKKSEPGNCDPQECGQEKEKLLRDIIRSVRDNAAASGIRLDREEVVKTVTACLERTGCSVI
jgi:ethanolamine utilization cobalamin adenosyltransferase